MTHSIYRPLWLSVQVGAWVLGCFASQPGQPLAKLPPVQVQALIDATPADGAALTLNLLPQDPAVCPKIADSVQATINGRALGLYDAGGTRQRKGGASYCEPPSFKGSGIPLAGDATIRLHDATGDFTVVAPGALRKATATLVQPSNGVLQPGQMGQIQLTPSIGTVTYATVSFVAASATTAAFYVEYPGKGASLSGDTISFSVPTTAAAATGSVQTLASLDVAVSQCQGPAACTVQTGVGGTVPASVGGP